MYKQQNDSRFSFEQEKGMVQGAADKMKMCPVDIDRRNVCDVRKKTKDTTTWDARSLREATARWDGTTHATISQLGFPAGGERHFNTQLPAAIATMAG